MQKCRVCLIRIPRKHIDALAAMRPICFREEPDRLPYVVQIVVRSPSESTAIAAGAAFASLAHTEASSHCRMAIRSLVLHI